MTRIGRIPFLQRIMGRKVLAILSTNCGSYDSTCTKLANMILGSYTLFELFFCTQLENIHWLRRS